MHSADDAGARRKAVGWARQTVPAPQVPMLAFIPAVPYFVRQDAPEPAAAAKAHPGCDVECFFTVEKLKLLAGAPGYERGCDYAQHLRVVKLRRWRGRIEATVEGRDDYEVRLWDEGYRLGLSCTCPVGQRQQLCKHGVATALTWLRERQAFDRERPARRAVIRLADVRTHLMALDKAELVERLLDSAQHAGEQLAAMKLDLAWRGPEGPNMPALKHAIRNWMWAGRDMHNNGITPMAVPRVELMAHVLRSLLPDGRGEDVLARRQHWPDAPFIIAGKFAAAGQAEEALSWVERGLGSATAIPDLRLLALGVEVCSSHGGADRAARLLMSEFQRRPSAKVFAMLRTVGTGAGQWPRLRREAFRTARRAVANCRRGETDDHLDFFGTRRDVSLLVEMHLVEGDVQAARSAAGRGYCRDDVWVSLADALGGMRPRRSMSSVSGSCFWTSVAVTCSKSARGWCTDCAGVGRTPARRNASGIGRRTPA